MKLLKHFIAAFILYSFTFYAYGQKVKGTIYEIGQDNNKVPLIGANVYWFGTTIGTTSDINGNFKLNRPDTIESKLIASYIGYKTDTIPVTNPAKPLEIVLASSVSLKEVEIKSSLPENYVSRVDPIHTQVINSGELTKAACCNLSESFETNATVDVNYSDAVTGAKQIQMLGLAGIYSQIMVENIPTVKGLATAYGLGYIPGSWMESIQISKGTSSVINGFESTTGQINVEYKKPFKGEKFYFNAYVNDLEKTEANFNSTIKLTPHWSTIILGHAENLDKRSDHNDDGFIDHPLMEQVNFSNRWMYDNHKNIEWRFGVNVLDENRQGGQWGFNSIRDIGNDSLYGIGIDTRRYQVYSKSGFLFDGKPYKSVGVILNATKHQQRSFYGLNVYNGDQNSFYGNILYQSIIGNTNHKFTAGVSFNYDEFAELFNDSAFATVERVPGVFFEYTYNHHEHFTLVAGIRADNHNNYGTFYTPRLHAKWNITEHTILRGSAGKGYRMPHVIAENTSLLASSRKFTFPESLNMEEAWNYGVNLTQYFDIAKREMRITADFYRTNFRNQVVIDVDADRSKVLFYNLDGISYSNSFQVELFYELIKRLDVNAAFRINDVKMTINDTLLTRPLVSRYKGLLTLSYKTNFEKWKFDLTGQYHGSMRIPDQPSCHEAPTMSNFSDNFILINTQITRKCKRLEMYIGVENLTDFMVHHAILAYDEPFGNYFDAATIWGPVTGRTIYGGLRFTIK